VVLAEDETHLNLLPHVRASLTLRGGRPEVPTPGTNRKVTVLGALEVSTGAWVYRLGRRYAVIGADHGGERVVPHQLSNLGVPVARIRRRCACWSPCQGRVAHVEGLTAVGYGCAGAGAYSGNAGSPLAGMRRCAAPITWVIGSRAKALPTHPPAGRGPGHHEADVGPDLPLLADQLTLAVLVAGEGDLVVPAGRHELPGQPVRADQGQLRARARGG
jgi:hypothetical protein